MNILELMKLNGLEVNLNTILVGWSGFGKFSRQLFPKDIIDYAVRLVSDDENQPADVWELASLSVSDTQELDGILSRFQLNNTEQEQRKWRVILVKLLLTELPNDYLQGLISLTEFWDKFGYPDDSPHVVQGRNNQVSPTDYYTQENYLKILDAHKIWVENEISNLV